MDVEHVHVLHAVKDGGQAAAPAAVNSAGGFVLLHCVYIFVVLTCVLVMCVVSVIVSDGCRTCPCSPCSGSWWTTCSSSSRGFCRWVCAVSFVFMCLLSVATMLLLCTDGVYACVYSG